MCFILQTKILIWHSESSAGNVPKSLKEIRDPDEQRWLYRGPCKGCCLWERTTGTSSCNRVRWRRCWRGSTWTPGWSAACSTCQVCTEVEEMLERVNMNTRLVSGMLYLPGMYSNQNICCRSGSDFTVMRMCRTGTVGLCPDQDPSKLPDWWWWEPLQYSRYERGMLQSLSSIIGPGVDFL